MLKFTLRDLFWLTAVGGLVLGWALDRTSYTALLDERMAVHEQRIRRETTELVERQVRKQIEYEKRFGRKSQD